MDLRSVSARKSQSVSAKLQACAKKDAKQLAAATLLEHLLESVPFQDLLYKSDKQQQLKDLQVRG